MRTMIPPLAGICSYETAARTGLSVDVVVNRLRRYAFIHSELIRCISAHLNKIPEMEIKGGLSLHLWENAEHNSWLRNRVTEMRQPPLHLDRVPDLLLLGFFEEVIRANGTLELLVAIYQVLLPNLIGAMERHVEETNPLADYPTVRILRFSVLEKSAQQKWANIAVQALCEEGEEPEKTHAWKMHLEAYLAAAGGVNGDAPRLEPDQLPPARAVTPFEPERIPQREQSFKRIRNSRGHPPSTEDPIESRLLHMAYVRYTEMHVPELLALIIHDWKAQPWPFYSDLCRHLWDEARHSMMGEVILHKNNINKSASAQEISFAAFPNTELAPRERYALLWGVEQDLMAKSGKQAEFALARDNGAQLLAVFQDFDWADEVLHTQIGRRWLLPAFGGIREELNSCAARVRTEYDQIVNEDLSKEGADWWTGFWAECKRENAPFSF